MSTSEEKLESESLRLRDYLFKRLNGRIIGPVNASIYRIKKQYRNRLLIRSKKTTKIQKSLTLALKNFKLGSGIKLTVDVDPISFN